ncbi:hypothetical protein [Chelatococcus reniformis]|uniref:Baseplate hub protein gp44/GpP-like second domain-containing protein n=1 Tax=Chelatococcus reniformis TaxID=1494448 RepID=A0A916UVA5_9HYPH|nr:hypothetical protein [Chelatococcus reniformis]GGC90274.1 hypothetical protein GCM10010994_55140 [Chelatococcus reniformis]
MADAPVPNPPKSGGSAAAPATGAAAPLLCEVRTTSGVYRDWMVVIVQYGMETGVFRNFRLIIAEPGDRKGNIIASLRLKPGDRVDIALAGKLVIKEGYILNRQVAFDAGRHAVQVDGYSKAAPFMDVSVEPRQYRNTTYEGIANSVLGKHGIGFRMGKVPDGANDPFRNVLPQYGETVFGFLSRLARRRGLWLSTEADGTIVAGEPQASGSGALIEEGRNILAGQCSIQLPSVNEVIGRSQEPGSDSLFGKVPSERSARAQVSGGVDGKRIVLAEGAASQKETQNRVNMEVAAIQAAAFRATITLQGWLKPYGSGLWELGDTVAVKSPTLFPTEGGEMQLRVWSVTYKQSNEGGTTTDIEFVNDAAWKLQFAPVDGGSSYSPGASQAQPETTT